MVDVASHPETSCSDDSAFERHRTSTVLVRSFVASGADKQPRVIQTFQKAPRESRPQVYHDSVLSLSPAAATYSPILPQ